MDFNQFRASTGGGSSQLSGPTPGEDESIGLIESLQRRLYHGSTGSFGQMFGSGTPSPIPEEAITPGGPIGGISDAIARIAGMGAGAREKAYKSSLGLGEDSPFTFGDSFRRVPTSGILSEQAENALRMQKEQSGVDIQAAMNQNSQQHQAMYDQAIAAWKAGDKQTAMQLLEEYKKKGGVAGAVSSTMANVATDPLMLASLPTAAGAAMIPTMLHGGYQGGKRYYQAAEGLSPEGEQIKPPPGYFSEEALMEAPEALTSIGFAGMAARGIPHHVRQARQLGQRGMAWARDKAAPPQEAAPVDAPMSPEEALREQFVDLEQQQAFADRGGLQPELSQQIDSVLGEATNVINTELARRQAKSAEGVAAGESMESSPFFPGEEIPQVQFRRLTPELAQQIAEAQTAARPDNPITAEDVLNKTGFTLGNTIYIGDKGITRLLQAKDVKGFRDNVLKFITHEAGHATTRQRHKGQMYDPFSGEPLTGEDAKPSGGGHYRGKKADSMVKELDQEFMAQRLEEILREHPEFGGRLDELQNNPALAQALLQEGTQLGSLTHVPDAIEIAEYGLGRGIGPGGKSLKRGAHPLERPEAKLKQRSGKLEADQIEEGRELLEGEDDGRIPVTDAFEMLQELGFSPREIIEGVAKFTKKGRTDRDALMRFAEQGNQLTNGSVFDEIEGGAGKGGETKLSDETLDVYARVLAKKVQGATQAERAKGLSATLDTLIKQSGSIPAGDRGRLRSLIMDYVAGRKTDAPAEAKPPQQPEKITPPPGYQAEPDIPKRAGVPKGKAPMADADLKSAITGRGNKWHPADDVARERALDYLAEHGMSPETAQRLGITADEFRAFIVRIKNNPNYAHLKNKLEAVRQRQKGVANTRDTGFSPRDLGISDRMVRRAEQGVPVEERPAKEVAATSGELVSGVQGMTRELKTRFAELYKKQDVDGMLALANEVQGREPAQATWFEKVRAKMRPAAQREVEQQFSHRKALADRIRRTAESVAKAKKAKALRETYRKSKETQKQEVDKAAAEGAAEGVLKPKTEKVEFSPEDLADLSIDEIEGGKKTEKGRELDIRRGEIIRLVDEVRRAKTPQQKYHWKNELDKARDKYNEVKKWWGGEIEEIEGGASKKREKKDGKLRLAGMESNKSARELLLEKYPELRDKSPAEISAALAEDVKQRAAEAKELAEVAKDKQDIADRRTIAVRDRDLAPKKSKAVVVARKGDVVRQRDTLSRTPKSFPREPVPAGVQNVRLVPKMLKKGNKYVPVLNDDGTPVMVPDKSQSFYSTGTTVGSTTGRVSGHNAPIQADATPVELTGTKYPPSLVAKLKGKFSNRLIKKIRRPGLIRKPWGEGNQQVETTFEALQRGVGEGRIPRSTEGAKKRIPPGWKPSPNDMAIRQRLTRQGMTKQQLAANELLATILKSKGGAGTMKPVSEAVAKKMADILGGTETLESRAKAVHRELPTEVKDLVTWQDIQESLGPATRAKFARPKGPAVQVESVTPVPRLKATPEQKARVAAARAERQAREAKMKAATTAAIEKRLKEGRLVVPGAPELTPGEVTRIANTPIAHAEAGLFQAIAQEGGNPARDMSKNFRILHTVGKQIFDGVHRWAKMNKGLSKEEKIAGARKTADAIINELLKKEKITPDQAEELRVKAPGGEAHKALIEDYLKLADGLLGKGETISADLVSRLSKTRPGVPTQEAPHGGTLSMDRMGRLKKVMTNAERELRKTLKAQGMLPEQINEEVAKNFKLSYNLAQESYSGYERTGTKVANRLRLRGSGMAEGHPTFSRKKKAFAETLREEGMSGREVAETELLKGVGEAGVGEEGKAAGRKTFGVTGKVEGGKVRFAQETPDPFAAGNLMFGRLMKGGKRLSNPEHIKEIKSLFKELDEAAAARLGEEDLKPRFARGPRKRGALPIPKGTADPIAIKDAKQKLAKMIDESKNSFEFDNRLETLADKLEAEGVLVGAELDRFKKAATKSFRRIYGAKTADPMATAKRVLSGADKAIAKAEEVAELGKGRGREIDTIEEIEGGRPAKTVFQKAGEETLKNRPLNDREAMFYEALGTAEKVSGVAKSAGTGGDISAPFRQTIALTSRQMFHNPRQLGRALKEMVLSYSEGKHAEFERALKQRPSYKDAMDAGLNLNDSITDHDAYKATDWLANVINRGRKLPGWNPVRWVAEVGEKYAIGAARAYTHYQNVVMLDAWEMGVNILKASKEGHFLATKQVPTERVGKDGKPIMRTQEIEFDAPSMAKAKPILERYRKEGYEIKMVKDYSARTIRELTDMINMFGAKSRMKKGALARAANVVFFSPQMIKSRLKMLYLNMGIPMELPDMPKVHLFKTKTGRDVNLDPNWLLSGGKQYKSAAVRRYGHEHIRSMVGFGTMMGALIYGAFKANGDNPEWETDPRSTDFMKIRAGHTTVSPFGDLQAYIRAGAQILMEQEKLRGSGRVQKANRVEIMSRLARGKLSPIAGLGVSYFTGRSGAGREVETLQAKAREALDTIDPLIRQDIFDITKENPNAMAPILIALAASGMTVTAGTGTKPWIKDYDTSQTDIRVSDEIRRLKLEPPKIGVRVPLKGRNAAGDKLYYTLKPEEREQYQSEVMPEISKNIDTFIASDAYKKMTDEQKRRTLKRIISRENKRYSAAKRLKQKYAGAEPVNDWWRD